LADFELGNQASTLLAKQQPDALNLGRLFNQLQDLLGADTSLKMPLRDLFGREVFRKLLLAKQPSQKQAFKDALIQDLQSVYSPALVARLEAFLNGLIGVEAGEQTSQLQRPSAPLPAVVALRGGADDEDVATVMASAATDPAAVAPAPEAGGAQSADRKPTAPSLQHNASHLLKPLLIAAGAGVVLLGVVLVSSRRPCPGGMQCSLASSFGLIKLDEPGLRSRYEHIAQQRLKAEFVPDLQIRQREVEQLQSELKRGTYSSALAAQLQDLHAELEDQIQSEQGYYDQYKRDEAIVSGIGVVKTPAEAQRLEAAAKRLDAIPATSLVRKPARYQAQLAALKLRPFLAEAKTAKMQQLMQQRAQQVEAERARVKAEMNRKESEARRQFALYQQQQQKSRNGLPAPKPKPKARISSASESDYAF